MKWINIKNEKPPKSWPFLAKTFKGIEMMVWKERLVDGKTQGLFGFYSSCCCCSGFCTTGFEWWMPLPQFPIKKLKERVKELEEKKIK